MKLLLVASLALVGALAVEVPDLLRQPPRKDAPLLPYPEHARTMSAAEFNMRLVAEGKDDALKRAVKTYEDAIDTSVNPCEDFKSYACGNFKGASTFSDVNLVTLTKQINTLRKGTSEKGPTSLVYNYWNSCVKALKNLDETLRGGALVKAIVDGFEAKSGLKFPLLKGKPSTKIGPEALAGSIGGLSNYFADITPLVQTLVFSKIKTPKLGYQLYLDAPFGVINPAYLQDPLYNVYKSQIVEIFAAPLRAYVDAIGGGASAKDIQSAAEALAEFERVLAKGATDNPGLEDIDNKYTLAEAKKEFGDGFNFENYFAALSNDDKELAAVLTAKDYQIAIASPKNFRVFAAALKARKNVDGSAISDSTVLNMIFFRIIYAKSAYLPQSLEGISSTASPATRFGRHVTRFPGMPEPSLKRAEYEIPDWHPLLVADQITRPEVQCAQLSGSVLEFANDRVFINAVYDPARRDEIQAGVFEMADGIATQFRGMLQTLDWMSDESKKAATEKVDNIQKNIIWPDIVFNDTALNAFYKRLPDLSKSNWLEQQLKLDKFNRYNELHQLTAKTFDRTEFGDTSIVNAFYRPNANSITILGAIVQPPFYDIDWPPALQYGAVGMAVGHEITHGFDNSGVFWDKDGALKPDTWMDSKSRSEFDKMARCVIDEYDGLCLTSKRENKQYCDNGAGTQGENIADNGGIRSGYRAYKAYEAKHGISPALPGKVVGKLNNDQLFFLAFARTWCDNSDAADYPWENEHSPAPLRIFGTLQNYDRFRTTFNCPVGARYAPAKHCEVWHTPEHKSPPRAKFAAAHDTAGRA